MTPSSVPVLVAGAGPTGLVAALTLLQNRIPVRIIDKEPHHGIGQRGNGIWPRTFEIFHFLRAHEVHQRATPMLPVQEHKPGAFEITKSFSMFAENDPTPSIPYSNPKLIGQPSLEGILRSHLEKHGCSVELGTELQSFEDNGKRVLAKLVKKRDGEEVTEMFEASFLIGADGGKGVTRKQLGLTFFGETNQVVSTLVGDICVEIEELDRKHFHIFGHFSSDFLMFRPTDEIAPDGMQFVMSLRDYQPKQLIADEKLMVECMSKMVGKELDVRKVVVVSEFRPNIRMVDKMNVGRVLIAGDAAHVHSPTGGQGLNTCVQDAFNLAWKVSLVLKGISPITLLDSYTAERLPVISEMLNITTGIFNKMAGASTIEGAMAREKRMNMLGVNYRSSSIVVDAFTPAKPVNAYGILEEGVLVAGDRAPDAPGLASAGTATRLFDVFSPTYHTVLVFAPDVAATTDVLGASRRYPEGVIRTVIVLPQGSEVTSAAQADVVVDQGGHAYRAYLAAKGETRVVVVRPDGVVGAIVHGAEGMGTYFSKIFI